MEQDWGEDHAVDGTLDEPKHERPSAVKVSQLNAVRKVQGRLTFEVLYESSAS